MADWSLPTVSRRTVLATGAVSLASLAGCSAVGRGDGDAKFNRIVVKTNTGQKERVELTLTHAKKNTATDRPVRGVHEAPASGGELVVDDFEGTPGFYSLSAFSERHGTHGMYSVNSYGPAVTSDATQFEVLIQEDGGIWLNLGEAGSKISLPE